jgi:hypothetical protein
MGNLKAAFDTEQLGCAHLQRIGLIPSSRTANLRKMPVLRGSEPATRQLLCARFQRDRLHRPDRHNSSGW